MNSNHTTAPTHEAIVVGDFMAALADQEHALAACESAADSPISRWREEDLASADADVAHYGGIAHIYLSEDLLDGLAMAERVHRTGNADRFRYWVPATGGPEVGASVVGRPGSRY